MKTSVLIIYGIIFLLAINLTVEGALVDDLIAAYTFDDTETSGTNSEELVNGYNLTINGATTGVSGIINECYSYITNDYADTIESSDVFDAGTGEFTVNAWYNTTEIDDFRMLFDIRNDDQNNDNIRVYLWDDSGADRIQIEIRTATGDVGYCQRTVTTNSDDGAWHMLTLLMNGSLCTDLIFDVDNVLQSTTQVALSGSNWNLDNLDMFIVGRHSGNAWYWEDRIDEVSYWKRAITTTEITNLYNGGDGLQYPFITDSCTPPASGDYEVDCSDACEWVDADEIPGDIFMTGSGTNVLSAAWTFTGSNQHIYIGSGCTFNIESGGEFN